MKICADTVLDGHSDTVEGGNSDTVVGGNSDTVVGGNSNTVVRGKLCLKDGLTALSKLIKDILFKQFK